MSIIEYYHQIRKKYSLASKHDVEWRHDVTTAQLEAILQRLNAAEAALKEQGSKKMKKVDLTASKAEEKLCEFEKLYDRHTGGWFIPGWLTEPFDNEQIENWQSIYKNTPNYAPVEMEVGRFYRALVSLVRPRRVLETGTNNGYSAFCIGKALREIDEKAKLFTLDLYEMEHIFKGTEVEPLIKFLAANSLEIDLAEFADESGVIFFDMLVLDSDHRYKTIIGEINRYAPFLTNGGVMILHDSMFFDGIAKVVEQLMERKEFELVNLPTPRDCGRGIRPPGITIARKVADVPANFLTPDPDLLELEVNLPGRNDLDTALLCRFPRI